MRIVTEADRTAVNKGGLLARGKSKKSHFCSTWRGDILPQKKLER